MVAFVICLGISYLGGFIAKKLKLPASFLLGGIIAVGAFSVLTQKAYCPKEINYLLQILSGLVIGSNITIKEIKGLKNIVLPMVFILVGLLLNNLLVGTLIHFASGIDILTALISSIPGGITESALMAGQMGADVPTVALMQLCRLIGSLLVFPLIIKFLTRKDSVLEEVIIEKEVKKPFSVNHLILSIIVAFIGGFIGYFLNFIPASLLVFSMIAVAIFNISTGNATCPRSFKKGIQGLSGVYVGCKVTMATIMGLKTLIIPIIILLLGFFVINTLIGLAASKLLKQDKGKMLFCCIPAGASDIALIASDMGYDSPDIAVFQLARLVTCIVIFPQVIKLFASLFM